MFIQANAAPHSGARNACSYAHRASRPLQPLHDDQSRQVESRSRQRRRIGPVGRRDPDDAASFRLQSRERRQRHAQLADAFALQQHLGQRAARPSAARQARRRVPRSRTRCSPARARNRCRARWRDAKADGRARDSSEPSGGASGRCCDACTDRVTSDQNPRTGGRCAWMRAIVCRVTSAAHCESTACGRPKSRRSSDRLVT